MELSTVLTLPPGAPGIVVWPAVTDPLGVDIGAGNCSGRVRRGVGGWLPNCARALHGANRTMERAVKADHKHRCVIRPRGACRIPIEFEPRLLQVPRSRARDFVR